MNFKVALVSVLKLEVFFRHGAVSVGLVGVEGVVGFGCDAYINSLQTGKRRNTAESEFHTVVGVVFYKLDNSEDTGEGKVWLFVFGDFDDMWCLGGWLRNGP